MADKDDLGALEQAARAFLAEKGERREAERTRRRQDAEDLPDDLQELMDDLVKRLDGGSPARTDTEKRADPPSAADKAKQAQRDLQRREREAAQLQAEREEAAQRERIRKLRAADQDNLADWLEDEDMRLALRWIG